MLIRRSRDKLYIDGPCEMLIRRSRDKVYIDGPCEMLIRSSRDKLLAEHFFVMRKFPGPIVLQTFELENSRAQPLFLLVQSIKVIM